MLRKMVVPKYYIDQLKERRVNGDLVQRLLDSADPLPLEYEEGVTKGELVAEMDIKVSFDYALPQYWFDDFFEAVGLNPLGYFVWDCDNHKPIPISKRASLLLKVYNHVIGEDE